MSTPDPTRQLLEQATRELRRLRAENQRLAERRGDAIAVVGLACRFPGGAHDPAAFWRLLAAGADLVGEIPPERWPLDPRLAELRGARFAGLLTAPLADFDADFFALSPREATRLDPQQRLLLELACEALDDAGLALDRLQSRAVGVFVGLSNLDYQERVDAQPELDAYAATGNLHSTAAGRISHALDLHGPCLAVDTACSSSLVAVHLAIRALQRHECDAAIAGGVHLMLSPRMMHKVALTQSLAPDGRCKTFDARADGFVRAEGCGVLALKRLADARRDGDPIRAVLRGSAVNHDGHTMGLTAPSPLAQERLLRAALADAGLQAHDITCIEAHGTGTSLGDPIEVEALQAVYGAPRPGGQRCALASLKTNLGHMEAAAGVGGLIKLILALEHEQIPAHLHLKALNPRIRLDDSALEIPTTPRAWPRAQVPRRAAVSSFGISGTNAHVLVEEAPLLTTTPPPTTNVATTHAASPLAVATTHAASPLTVATT
ncbi:MAG: polyketide synthase, partial [Myxococcales bacterium]|nr:polyketide synthase [Myxococcales bacterium]